MNSDKVKRMAAQLGLDSYRGPFALVELARVADSNNELNAGYAFHLVEWIHHLEREERYASAEECLEAIEGIISIWRGVNG